MFKVFYINFNLYILLIILQTVAMHVSRRVNCYKVYVSAQIKNFIHLKTQLFS